MDHREIKEQAALPSWCSWYLRAAATYATDKDRRVASCFGGAAVYDMRKAVRRRYAAAPDANMCASEHVMMHMEGGDEPLRMLQSAHWGMDVAQSTEGQPSGWSRFVQAATCWLHREI